MSSSKKETLIAVSRLYDLVEEMNEISKSLRLAGVEVFIGQTSNPSDPLGRQAVVRVTMHPDSMSPMDPRFS